MGARMPHPALRALRESLFGSAEMHGAGASVLQSAIAQSQLAADAEERVAVRQQLFLSKSRDAHD